LFLKKVKAHVMARTGRPPVFRQRKAFTVLLDARELHALHREAKRLDVTASAFVRGLILAALSARKKERA
jgi:hypothetical protein